MNARQFAESDEFKIVLETFQKLAENCGNNRSVLSAPEISLDAPIKIERESKFQLADNDAQRIADIFLTTVLY